MLPNPRQANRNFSLGKIVEWRERWIIFQQNKFGAFV